MILKTISLTTFLTFCLPLFIRAQENDPFETDRKKMVDDQISKRGVSDKRVLAAMRKVKRHIFVFPSDQPFAYEDHPLPIGYDQTISQPFIVAYMTEAARLGENDRVLEIGTGSGYQAAVLAELAKEVFTLEILKPLYESAKTRLLRLGYRNIHFKLDDGAKGWPEEAPFDKIMVTAAGPDIPRPWLEQLREGGRLVLPLANAEDSQTLWAGLKKNGKLEMIQTMPVRFVPLVRGPDSEGKDKRHGEEKIED